MDSCCMHSARTQIELNGWWCLMTHNQQDRCHHENIILTRLWRTTEGKSNVKPLHSNVCFLFKIWWQTKKVYIMNTVWNSILATPSHAWIPKHGEQKVCKKCEPPPYSKYGVMVLRYFSLKIFYCFYVTIFLKNILKAKVS